MEPENNNMPSMPKKPNGALIGTIIIILIIIIGGIYLLSNSTEEATVETETPYLDSESLSDSDELESIEADLEADMSLEGVGEEVEADMGTEAEVE